MPGVPLHQGGLTLDYRAFNSPLEILADGRFTSPDNRQYLPGYVTADAGLGYDFTHVVLYFAHRRTFYEAELSKQMHGLVLVQKPDQTR